MRSTCEVQKNDFHPVQTKHADKEGINRDNVIRSKQPQLLPRTAAGQPSSEINKEECHDVHLLTANNGLQGTANRKSGSILRKQKCNDYHEKTSKRGVCKRGKEQSNFPVNMEGKFRKRNLDNTTVGLPLRINQNELISKTKFIQYEVNTNSPETNQIKCECIESDGHSCQQGVNSHPQSGQSISKDVAKTFTNESRHHYIENLQSKNQPSDSSHHGTSSEDDTIYVVSSCGITSNVANSNHSQEIVPNSTANRQHTRNVEETTPDSYGIRANVANSVVNHFQEIVAPPSSDYTSSSQLDRIVDDTTPGLCVVRSSVANFVVNNSLENVAPSSSKVVASRQHAKLEDEATPGSYGIRLNVANSVVNQCEEIIVPSPSNPVANRHARNIDQTPYGIRSSVANSVLNHSQELVVPSLSESASNRQHAILKDFATPNSYGITSSDANSVVSNSQDIVVQSSSDSASNRLHARIVDDATPESRGSKPSDANSVAAHPLENAAPSSSEKNAIVPSSLCENNTGVALSLSHQNITDIEHSGFNGNQTLTVDAFEMVVIKPAEKTQSLAESKTEMGESSGAADAVSTGYTVRKDAIRTVPTCSSNLCSVVKETEIMEEEQLFEGPVIQLDEDGSNLDYMHVFWVDEESEVICEEDKQENSIRQMMKREKDRQKKRAMRANPEYREKETAKARLRMKTRRQDPEYREQERRRDRDRRRQARLKTVCDVIMPSGL